MTKIIKFKNGHSVELLISTTTNEVAAEIWYDIEGRMHRNQGLPAVIAIEDDYALYYIHGKLQ